MAKKDNLPKAMELDTELGAAQGSTVTYANEVVAIIAGVAAGEVEGIAGMCNVPSGGILSRNKNITKGVKVEVGTEEVSCDLYLMVEYGYPIQKVAHEAQDGVRRAIEAMTGLHVVRVDVHVQGVSFEKENSANDAGAKKASLLQGEVAHIDPQALKPAVSDDETGKVEFVNEAADAAGEETRTE